MSIPRSVALVAFGLLTLGTQTARAADAPSTSRIAEVEPPQPKNFVGLFAGTTLLQRPYQGGVVGPQGDLNASAGVGHFVTKRVALELDIGATVLDGKYAGAALVPAVVWCFHDVFYAAGRFIVPVHPTVDLTLAPGLGAIYVFENGFAPLVEVNALSTVGSGQPTLGASFTLGSIWLF